MADATAEVVQNFFGDKNYQKNARGALPILVRQARARAPIFYAFLAKELNMSSARHLNRPLGSIGKTLIELGDEWGESIPPIQCLVINQRDRTPGLGYGWFMSEDDWSGMTPAKRREALDDQFHLVWSYPRWGKVLEALHLKPLKENFNDLVYEPLNGVEAVRARNTGA